MNLKTNRSFKVLRKGQVVLQDLAAQIQPTGTRILMKFDVPAEKSYQVRFAGLYDVQEQDTLINQNDEAETYRVRGVERWDIPPLAHTKVVVVGMWGEH